VDEPHNLDDRLAQLTDDVLADKAVTGDGMDGYDQVVQDLKGLMTGAPSAEYRDQLSKRLEDEFRASRRSFASPWGGRQRLLLLAASLAAVLAAGALVLTTDTGAAATSGTAIGAPGLGWAFLAVGVVGVAVALWHSRR
jgi:hypothetical protein